MGLGLRKTSCWFLPKSKTISWAVGREQQGTGVKFACKSTGSSGCLFAFLTEQCKSLNVPQVQCWFTGNNSTMHTHIVLLHESLVYAQESRHTSASVFEQVHLCQSCSEPPLYRSRTRASGVSKVDKLPHLSLLRM